MTRLQLLAAMFCAALATVGVAQVRDALDQPQLTWLATARQFGPVSYRDPAGAISPDGEWLAYSEGRFLRVRPVGGGAGVDFEPGPAQIRNLHWNGSDAVVADGNGAQAPWAEYDRPTRTRRPVAFTPDDHAVCVTRTDGRSRVTMPCGAAPLPGHPPRDAYGPVALSPDGKVAYAALANARGTVDLWSIPVSGGQARQLTSFDRDSYAPSVANDGSVVFKVQSYRTHVAQALAVGGPSQALATFQSETPSWDPAGKLLGITYGTWRRVPDDAKYPDIAQDAGIIAVDPAHPAQRPANVVQDSVSEDQSLCWSPNGRWIAFHSHKDMSDDIWLRHASGDSTATRITMLGRGAEAGWPRWSRDGRWLLFNAASKTTRRTVIYVVGVNQDSGEVREAAHEIALDGLNVDVFHAEWIDGGETIAAIGKEAPGRHVIFTVARGGGAVKVIHKFESEHDFPGLGVSPDGRQLAFIAPAPDGFFQVFRIRFPGGTPIQVTSDPTNKTQPAWSPDGLHIAFTVWNYEAQFWRLSQ